MPQQVCQAVTGHCHRGGGLPGMHALSFYHSMECCIVVCRVQGTPGTETEERRARCPQPKCEEQCPIGGHDGHIRDSNLCGFTCVTGAWCSVVALAPTPEGIRACVQHTSAWFCQDCGEQNTAQDAAESPELCQGCGWYRHPLQVLAVMDAGTPFPPGTPCPMPPMPLMVLAR